MTGNLAIEFLGEVAITLGIGGGGVEHQHQIELGVRRQVIDEAATVREMQLHTRIDECAAALRGQPISNHGKGLSVLFHHLDTLQWIVQQFCGQTAGKTAQQQHPAGIRGLGHDIGRLLPHRQG